METKYVTPATLARNLKSTNNPIQAAIEPTRAAALQAAREMADRIVAGYFARLDAAGGDLNKAFPFPSSNLARPDYVKAKNQRALALTLTTHTNRQEYRHNAPHLCVRSDDGVARFYRDVAEDATAQFDAYVSKLTAKIGPVVGATLHGDNVWSYSTLTVTKVGDFSGCPPTDGGAGVQVADAGQ